MSGARRFRSLAIMVATSRRWPALLVLALLAPFTAEISIGDLPFTPTGLLSMIFFVPIYGAGAVLARELTVPRGSGLPGLFVLGLAYCLIEEGLALRSLTSPTIYHGIGAAMGGRIAGINGVYLFLQLINHAVWSIVLPVMITELIFPAQRNRRWLRLPGMVITSVIFVIGVALTALSARTTIDPDYTMPTPASVVLVLVIAALVALAVGPLAHRNARPVSRPRGGATPPGAAAVLITSATAAVIFLAPLWLPRHFRWSFAGGPGVLVMIIIGLTSVIGYPLLLRHWSAFDTTETHDRAPWTTAHCAAAVAGLWLGHAIFGAVIGPDTVRDRLVVAGLLVISAGLLAVLVRRAATADQATDSRSSRSR